MLGTYNPSIQPNPAMALQTRSSGSCSDAHRFAGVSGNSRHIGRATPVQKDGFLCRIQVDGSLWHAANVRKANERHPKAMSLLLPLVWWHMPISPECAAQAVVSGGMGWIAQTGSDTTEMGG